MQAPDLQSIAKFFRAVCVPQLAPGHCATYQKRDETHTGVMQQAQGMGGKELTDSVALASQFGDWLRSACNHSVC